MTSEDIQGWFTRSDGSYLFARWGRPIAPVVFGVEEATLATIKGAFEAMVALTGHTMSETDPELGSNLMVFFVRDWDELGETPNLDKLIPELPSLLTRLKAADANQYRIFRFDDAGAIQACFVFVRMDRHLSDIPAETLALVQAAQTMLVWSDTAFHDSSPVARHPDTGATILRPDVAGILRAAYDPVMPDAARDPSHSLRLQARLGPLQ
jgi:hypothetical protein